MTADQSEQVINRLGMEYGNVKQPKNLLRYAEVLF